MKNIFLTVIKRGGFDLTAMLDRIAEYHISGKLSDADRDELLAAARGEAVPGVDPTDEIQRLWAEVHKLTARVNELEGGAAGDDEAGGSVAEYVQPTGAHDAYFAGAVVSYNGKTYTCIAPEGVACVWSPDVMPTYWEAM